MDVCSTMPSDTQLPACVAVSNNLGVSRYEESDFDKAHAFFLQALEPKHRASYSPSLHLPTFSECRPPLSDSPSAKIGRRSEEFNAVVQTGLPRHNSVDAKHCSQRAGCDEGMERFMEALPLETSSNSTFSGEQDSDIARAVVIFNLAQCHHMKKEYLEGERLYRESHDAFQFIQRQNPSAAIQTKQGTPLSVAQLVVRTLHKVGQMQYYRNSHNDAKATFLEACNIARETLRGDDPDVAAALNCLGVVHYHANCSSGARRGQRQSGSGDEQSYAYEVFHEALQIQIYALGVNHRDVATTLNNIARIHVEREELDEALNTYKEALLIRRRILGDNHVDVAATTFNIGQTHHLRCEYDAAMGYYKEFLSMAETMYGADEPHRDVSIVLCLMGEILQENHMLHKAMEFYNVALQVGIDALGGPTHAEIALTLNKIGSCQLELGNVEGALKTYERGLQIERVVLDSLHPNLIVTLKNIGELYRQLGEYDKALVNYQELLSIRIKKLVNVDPKFYGKLSQLGARGEKSDQLNVLPELPMYCDGQITQQSKALCESFLNVAETVNEIAMLFCKKGGFDVALQYLEESLRIRGAILGDHHPDVAINRYNLALIHKWNGSYDQAMDYCRETLRSTKETAEHEHICAAMALNLMGKMLQEKGNIDAALDHHKEGLRVARRILGNEANVTIAEILTDLGNIYNEKGQFPEMMKSFTEAARLYMMCGLSPDNITVSSAKNPVNCAIDNAEPDLAPAA